MQRVWRISPKLSKIIQKLFFMFIAFGVCNLAEVYLGLIV